MDKPFQRSIILFRRDLRVEDNTALNEAARLSQEIVPLFIFDPRQLEDNAYRGDNALQFMVESLKELSMSIEKKGGRLNLAYGEPQEVLVKCCYELKASAVFLNEDYTPFSKARDEALKTVCIKSGVDLKSFEDLLLCSPRKIFNTSGKPYTVYSAFARRCAHQSIAKPKSEPVKFCSEVFSDHLEDLLGRYPGTINLQLAQSGGRKAALKILSELSQLADYEQARNFPAKRGTSNLSAHNKFGTISIREFYHAVKDQFGAAHTLIKELLWRDFFYHVAGHFPYVFGQEFQARFRKLRWKRSEKHFSAWAAGLTGFPIIDAGMRELNSTGYMHNRVRMIVASFLVKDLHLDWRLGERYFAQKLVDYDPAVNNGNWQWAASTGCDAQPFFRIFNPWLQQKKFDPDCEYIKHWIPELREVPVKSIHNLAQDTYLVRSYPAPLVVHELEKIEAIDMFEYVKEG